MLLSLLQVKVKVQNEALRAGGSFVLLLLEGSVKLRVLGSNRIPRGIVRAWSWHLPMKFKTSGSGFERFTQKDR